MSAVFVGETALTVECAQLWLARGRRIAGVASAADDVRKWARDCGIPQATRVTDLAPVRAGKPFDYLFNVARPETLPAEVLALPRVLPIGFHDGLLPADAGWHAGAWALIRGATTHGITWYEMTARPAAGDILVQRVFGLGPQDTSWLVNMRCYEAGLDAFGELASRIESGTLTRTVQDLNRRTYHAAADRPQAALTVDPGDAAERIAALVRACDFGPHTNTFGTAKVCVGGKLLAVGSARVATARSSAAPGTVLACEGDSVTVATATHPVVLGGITTLAGRPVDLPRCGIARGVRLAALSDKRREALTTAMWAALVHEAMWVERLESVRAIDLPCRHSLEQSRTWNPPVEVPGLGTAALAVAAIGAFLSRIGGGDTGHIRAAAADQTGHIGVRASIGGVAGPAGIAHAAAEDLVAATVPLAVPAVKPGVAFEDYRLAVEAELDTVAGAGGYLRDVFLRHPGLHAARDLDDGLPIVLDLSGDAATALSRNTVVWVAVSPQGATRWHVAGEALSEADTRSLVGAFAEFQQRLGEERAAHRVVAAQAARPPHARAVAADEEMLAYQQIAGPPGLRAPGGGEALTRDLPAALPQRGEPV